MKQYLFAVHGVEELSEEQMKRSSVEVDKVNDELRAAGAWLFAGGLLPPDSATVVRVDDGRATVTDGPFAETKEQMAGFWVLRFADLDEALHWAEKCSAACMGPIEVRPFHDDPVA